MNEKIYQVSPLDRRGPGSSSAGQSESANELLEEVFVHPEYFDAK